MEKAGRFLTKHGSGQDKEKRVWAIKNNHPWQLYLSTYWAIDAVDHLLKHCYIYFLSWKYWHSPISHAFSMAVIAAYEMYCECAEGNLDTDWHIDPKDRLSFCAFWLKASEQMLEYGPASSRYPGNNMMWGYTKQPRRKWSYSPDPSSSFQSSNKKGKTSTSLGVTKEAFIKACTSTRCHTARLCNSLESLKKHFTAMKKDTNWSECNICGELTCFKSMICNKYMCWLNGQGSWSGATCVTSFHEKIILGLQSAITNWLVSKRYIWNLQLIQPFRGTNDTLKNWRKK